MAFINGFLSSDDETLLTRCKELEQLILICEKIEKAIKAKQTEIDRLIAKIS